MSRRPGQWHLVGHDQDPVPADGYTVTDVANRLAARAVELRDAHTVLGRLDTTGWVGKAQHRFAAKNAATLNDLDHVAVAYERAASLIRSFAPRVQNARTGTEAALRKAEHADETLRRHAHPPHVSSPPLPGQLDALEQHRRIRATAKTELVAANRESRKALRELDDYAKTTESGLWAHLVDALKSNFVGGGAVGFLVGLGADGVALWPRIMGWEVFRRGRGTVPPNGANWWAQAKSWMANARRAAEGEGWVAARNQKVHNDKWKGGRLAKAGKFVGRLAGPLAAIYDGVSSAVDEYEASGKSHKKYSEVNRIARAETKGILTGAGALSGAAMGATIGSAAGPAGIVIGGIVGGVVGSGVGSMAGDAIKGAVGEAADGVAKFIKHPHFW